MAHELANCIHRNLNVADFNCKHKGIYTLNVSIRIWIFVRGLHLAVIFSLKTSNKSYFSYLMILLIPESDLVHHI